MSQLDLFASNPIETQIRCGYCVHRNAAPNAPEGYCTPVGWRRNTDAPCAWWFGLSQLHEDPYGRRKPQ